MSIPVLLLYGGSFNPFHTGHLDAIQICLREIAPAQMVVIPNFQSPFKKEVAIACAHRFGMIQAAIKSFPQVSVDTLELQEKKSSYTIETLKTFKQKQKLPLVFVLGSDSFENIATWHQAELFHRCCHFAVLKRKNSENINYQKISESIFFKLTQSPKNFCEQESGLVYVCEEMPTSVTATEIRKTKNETLLPESVQNYLKEQEITLEQLLSAVKK